MNTIVYVGHTSYTDKKKILPEPPQRQTFVRFLLSATSLDRFVCGMIMESSRTRRYDGTYYQSVRKKKHRHHVDHFCDKSASHKLASVACALLRRLVQSKQKAAERVSLNHTSPNKCLSMKMSRVFVTNALHHKGGICFSAAVSYTYMNKV